MTDGPGLMCVYVWFVSWIDMDCVLEGCCSDVALVVLAFVLKMRLSQRRVGKRRQELSAQSRAQHVLRFAGYNLEI